MVQVFASSFCELGEGIYFDDIDRYLYWVDIGKSIIFRKNVDIQNEYFDSYYVGIMPSVILSVEMGVIKFVDKNGICLYNIAKDEIQILNSNLSTYNTAYRANDGVTLKNGTPLFGSMHLPPDMGEGELYTVNTEGLKPIEGLSFHIPNTFIELDGDILISDSLEQKTYKISLNFDKAPSKELWKDFSNSKATPDGGCADSDGNIYIAMWDGACIMVLDEKGKTIKTISIPVPKPTNCITVDDRWLYVTSAREGLTDAELLSSPLSGSVIIVDLGADRDK